MRNINTLDRLLRALLGLTLLELAFFWLSSGWQIAAYAAGAIMLVTSAIRFCPLYRVFGFSTASGGDYEKVRPVFQEMFKRNGFSMLSIALVDFHDAMELALDAANAKNASKVIELYTPISEKLKAVEAEANDAEIQTFRVARASRMS